MPIDKTVAVAFGGGGARGLAHIHIIEVLDELGIKPVAISGTSIGAIMAVGMASGMAGEEIRSFVLNTIGNSKNVAKRLWESRRSSWKSLFSEGLRFGQFDIERILKAFLPEDIPDDFSQLKIPTKLVATDYYGHHETLMDSGNLRSAIAASAAIPALFKPIKRDNRYLVDGGIYNPIPFDYLKGLADVIIAIDVAGYPTGDDKKLPGTIDAVYGASQLMMQSGIRLRVQQSPPDILLVPEVHNFRVLDFMQAKEILNASSAIRDILKKELDKVLS